jgi:hypothetical protein
LIVPKKFVGFYPNTVNSLSQPSWPYSVCIVSHFTCKIIQFCGKFHVVIIINIKNGIDFTVNYVINIYEIYCREVLGGGGVSPAAENVFSVQITLFVVENNCSELMAS